MRKKLKVLVVDDSYVFRKMLSAGLSSDPAIESVITAEDPFDARDKIIEFQPDVMTCDVEMPKMNGIEFIRKLLPQYMLPVVVVSSVSKAVLDAMNAGAVDFVVKPEVQTVKDVKAFIDEVVLKVKIASTAKVCIGTPDSHFHGVQVPIKPSGLNEKEYDRKLIAIGASTGGTEAIYSILMKLPSKCPGIVIVQHIPPVFSKMFADRLNDSTQFSVKEAEDGDFVESGKVLVAPGDRHLKIVKIGERYRTECFKGERINGHCPSVDILFDSVAVSAGANAMG
ncbi:MAG TPA: chemotaxis protein CheB, partial [Lachnospiraceae bacterium]|nr:chemotaxis protein CheB [Lachnospiraceae bacterium]